MGKAHFGGFPVFVNDIQAAGTVAQAKKLARETPHPEKNPGKNKDFSDEGTSPVN